MAEEENPFLRITLGGGVVHGPMFEPGVYEHTLYLKGNKAYPSDSNSMRIILVEGTNTQIIFQDFSPTPQAKGASGTHPTRLRSRVATHPHRSSHADEQGGVHIG